MKKKQVFCNTCFKYNTQSSERTQFSLLPPIIRYLVLENLYEKYPDNIMIIDKLSLVLLKALDKEAAIEWIEKRKITLEKLPSITLNAKKDIIGKR